MEKVRLNLKIPREIRDYLKERAYEKSVPSHTVSLTEYLVELIRNDMSRNRI